MDELSILRQASLELYSTDSKDVVKVAGILRRLKNWVRKITDPEYKSKVTEFESNTKSLKQNVENLDSLLSDLQSSVKSGDVDLYTETYHKILDASGKLYDQLKNLGNDAKGVEKLMTYYTKEEMKEPRFKERFQKALPKEFDIELGKSYNEPLKSFKWYEGLSSDSVYIREGEGTSAFKQLLSRTKDRLVKDKILSEEEVDKVLTDNLPEFVASFKDSIVNGTLKRVEPKIPSPQIQRAEAGLTEVYLTTAPFFIPNTDIKLQAAIIMIDKRTSLSPMVKLSLMRTNHVTILGGSKKANRFDELRKFAADNRQETIDTNISDMEIANALREGYKKVFGQDPTAEVLGFAWAQVVFETGHGQSMRNYNFGNVKADKNWINSGNLYHTKDTKEYDKEKGQYVPFKGAAWRAYNTPVEGAIDYWKVVGNKNFNLALQYAAAGDPQSASIYLGNKTYYTARIKEYTNPVVSLYNKFQKEMAPKISGLQSAPAPPPGERLVLKEREGDVSEGADDKEINDLMKTLQAAGPLERLVRNSLMKKALPTTNVTIIATSGKKEEQIEYARVTSNILNQYIDAKTSIHESPRGIEITCSAIGNTNTVSQAVKALCNCTSIGMRKFVGADVETSVLPSSISKHSRLEDYQIDRNHRIYSFGRIYG